MDSPFTDRMTNSGQESWDLTLRRLSWLLSSPLQTLVVSEGWFRQAWEEGGHGFKNSSISLDKNTRGCNVIRRGHHLVPVLSCHCLSGWSCRRGQNLATEAWRSRSHWVRQVQQANDVVWSSKEKNPC